MGENEVQGGAVGEEALTEVGREEYFAGQNFGVICGDYLLERCPIGVVTISSVNLQFDTS